MFLDNLSIAVLRACEKQNLTYEAAAEKCNVSPEYIGRLVRKKYVPRLGTLEKLCKGLGLSPNALLIPPELHQTAAKQEPMPITVILCHESKGKIHSVPVCPACGGALEWQKYTVCQKCQQRLDWSRLEDATIVFLRDEDQGSL